MPEAIVVGVDRLQNDLRWEDCDYEDVSGLPTEKGKMFYEFLGTELIPYLETSYNIAPFNMFVGYDITANFGNYYLFKDRSFSILTLVFRPFWPQKWKVGFPPVYQNWTKPSFII